MTKIARIMEIERFAIHDGPGVRTTIFLQGCPLRCPWCANPESQTILEKILYNKSKCVLCGECEKHCPTQSIKIVDGAIKINRSMCIKCKKCARYCLQDAIYFIGQIKSIDEIMNIVLKDKMYYEESNGGVTISGGEPFVQYDCLHEILKKCKENGIHTAVETTGDTEWENVEKIFHLIDLFLFDVKHIQPSEIKRVTKGNGERILENLRKLALLDPAKIVIRVPVIPNFNYNDETILGIIDFAKSLKIPEINLLPYHNLGKSKYEHLGLDYPMGDLPMLKKEDLQKYNQKNEVFVKIGG